MLGCRSTRTMENSHIVCDSLSVTQRVESARTETTSHSVLQLTLDSFELWVLPEWDSIALRATTFPTATLAENSGGSAATAHAVSAVPKIGNRTIVFKGSGLSIGKSETGSVSGTTSIASLDSTRFCKSEERMESKSKKTTFFGTWLFWVIACFALVFFGTFVFRRWKNRIRI